MRRIGKATGLVGAALCSAVVSAVLAAPASAAPDPHSAPAALSAPIPLSPEVIENAAYDGCLTVNGARQVYLRPLCTSYSAYSTWRPSRSTVSEYYGYQNLGNGQCLDSDKLTYTNPCEGSTNRYKLFRRSYSTNPHLFELQDLATKLCLRGYGNGRVVPQVCTHSSDELWFEHSP